MYSYEDRVRTVRLYIKYGRSASATIRELGYPSRKNLARWYRAFIEAGDLPAGYRRSRPRYSAERKQIAVDHYLSHGCNFAGTTRALGYPCRAVLAAWGHELRPDIRKRLVSNAPNVPSSPVLKQAAVIELCTRNGGARVIAEKIGVSRPTLYNWQNKLLGREAPASMKRHKNLASAPERAELEQQLESLRRDIRQLQLEHDILKKANELLKKGLGIDPRLLSNREKTTLVDALRQIYALPELLAVLGLARSSYFYHRARLLVADKYAGVRRVITDMDQRPTSCTSLRGNCRSGGRSSSAGDSSVRSGGMRRWQSASRDVRSNVPSRRTRCCWSIRPVSSRGSRDSTPGWTCTGESGCTIDRPASGRPSLSRALCRSGAHQRERLRLVYSGAAVRVRAALVSH